MAYSNACLHRSLPSSMHFLFQKSLKIGKWIRSSLPSPFRQISLGTQLFQLICSTLDKPSLFFLGNSEINRKIIAFFNAQERYQITLCTRSPHSAEEFAKKQHIQCVGWDALTQWQNHDVVICGTNHHEYLIVPEQIVHPPKTKFIFDLGIPRNTDPRFSFHPHITLMNIEDLGHFMKVRREEEKEAIKQMSEQVRQAVDKQLFIFNSKTQQATQCV
jgi:glutamyl-tRNA reductase